MRATARFTLAWLAGLCLLLGCPTGDDDDNTGDDDVGDDDDDDACDEGYVDDGGECVPEHCGVGTWGDLPVDAGTVFVDAAADPGGDGSEAAPFDTLQAGIDAAGGAGGGLVAAARGTYAENLLLDDLHQNIELAGRCLELVTLDAAGGGEEAQGMFVNVQQMGSDPLTVSGLTITGAMDVGVAVVGGKLTLRDVHVLDNQSVGVGAYNQRGKVTLERVIVEGTTPDVAGEFGRGINAQWEATVTATDCSIVGNAQYGVYANDHAVVTLTRVEVRDTVADSTGQYGWGVYAREASTLTLDQVTIDGNTDAGLYLSGDGTEGTAVDVAITSTALDSLGGDGHGVIVAHGAELHATDTTVEGNHTGGLLVQDPDSLVTLVGGTIRGTLEDDGGLWGYGAQVVYGGALVADGTVVEGNVGLGVGALLEDSVATLTSVSVLDTLDSPSPLVGAMGLAAQDGGTLVAEDCLVEDYAIVGAYAVGAGAVMELTGVDILDGTATDDGDRGGGIGVAHGASLTATMCGIDRAPVDGILVHGAGATATLTDVTVTETQRATTAGVGIGVAAQDHATVDALRLYAQDNEGPGLRGIAAAEVTCTDCLLSGNTFAGVVNQDATIQLVDTVVEGNTADANVGGGVGIYAEDLGAYPDLIVSGGSVTGHDYAALWLVGTGAYQLDGVLLDDIPGVEHKNPQGGLLLFHGDAVYATGGITAWDGSLGLHIAGSTLSGCGGPALFLDGASATLDGNAYSGNALDLLQQDCDGIDPPEGIAEVGTSELCPQYDVLTQDLSFEPFFNEVPVSD